MQSLAPDAPLMVQQLNEAVLALNAGKLVAMPTETVYGLAARIDLPDAIQSIFQTKGRPSFDPLIVHVAHIEQAKKLVTVWPEAAEILSRHFWPGPLTMILPKNKNLISNHITSGMDTVAIRIPQHEVALKLLEMVQCPLAAPSANRFMKTSPTKLQHVIDEFPDEIENGNILVLEGGSCLVGVESTVAKVEENKIIILRPGGVTKTQIEKVLQTNGLIIEVTSLKENTDLNEPLTGSHQISPGQAKHHYMPKKPLSVFWGSDQEIKTHQGSLSSSTAVIDLGEDPFTAARALYASLRDADDLSDKEEILIYRRLSDAMIYHGLWDAIDDRLVRAATHRLGKVP